MEKLGTLEFCAALNGDDPLQAIAFLKRFVQTVRKERAEALSEDSNEELSHSEEEESESEEEDDDESLDLDQPPTKKAKIEKWKLDTKSYNVPFVGTSTFKGPCGTVQKGKWPTGFIEAYLQQSPKAMEILGSGMSNDQSPLVPPHGPLHERLLRRKESSGKKLSSELFSLYIQAVGEIASCGIPLEILRQQMKYMRKPNVFAGDDGKRNSDKYGAKLEKNVQLDMVIQQLISTIMKEHVDLLFTVLNNESFNSGSQSYSLIEAALTTLANLASTSIGAAREITRGLDSNLKGSVLHRLAPARLKYHPKHYEYATYEPSKSVDKKDLDRKDAELKAGASFLSLASVLLESDDFMMVSYAISPGVKETKMQPGLAFIAIQRVADLHSYHRLIQNAKTSVRKIYFANLHRFFASISMLLASTSKQDQSRALHRVTPSSMISLFHGDVLENFAQNVCMDVEKGADNNFLHALNHQSRHLIFTILSDKEQSPFLKLLHSNRSSENIISSIKRNLTRCMQILLANSSDLIQTRTFMIECFVNTPKLFTAYFNLLSIPEMSHTFSCISSYAFATLLIEEGPFDLTEENCMDTNAEKLAFQIMPKGLSKTILTKSLQTSNSLLVIETLKCMSAIIKRLNRLIANVRTAVKCKDTIEKCISTVCKHLPDLQVLLSLRSKFDPFSPHKLYQSHANTIVLMYFCDVLQLYASTFTNTISSQSFDWIKILPNTCVEEFCSVELCLQIRLLSTLSSIYKSYQLIGEQSNALASSRAFRSFCYIMIHSDNQSIYTYARNLAFTTLQNIIAHETADMVEICQELNSWIDSISLDTLPMFCNLLDTIQMMTVQHSVIVSNAWQQYNSMEIVDKISVSPLVTAALVSLASNPDSFCDSFCRLICTVMTASLFQQKPKCIASIIRFTLADILDREDTGHETHQLRLLLQYATALLENENKLIQKACLLLDSVFGESSAQSKAAQYLLDLKSREPCLNEIYQDAVIAPSKCTFILRQCIHHLYVDRFNEISNENFDNLLVKLFPIFAERQENFVIINDLLDSRSSVTMVVNLLIIATSIKCQDIDKTKLNTYWSAASMNLICSLIEKYFDLIKLSNIQQIELHSSQMCFFSAMIPLLPSERLDLLQRPILELCASFVSSDDEIGIPLLNLLLKSINYNSNELSHRISSKAMFKLWKTLSENKFSHSSAMSVRNALEVAMAKLLINCENHGLNAATLLSSIRCQNIEHVIELSIKNDSYHQHRHTFLLSLLRYDASLFAESVFKLLCEGKNATLNLDDVIATATMESISQLCDNTLPSTVVETLVKRLTSLMNQKDEKALLGVILKAVRSLLCKGQLTQEVFLPLVRKSADFLRLLRKRRKMGIPTNIELDFLSFLSKTLISKELEDLSQVTATILFAHFVASILKVLKSSNDAHYEGSNQFLLIVIDTLNSMDVAVLAKAMPSDINKMMLSCMKYGIKSIESISPYCLVIVRLLLILLSQLGEGGFNNKEQVFKPHHIFAMCFSHSNFETMAMKSNDPSRRELISLFICCLALDSPKVVPLQWEKISALLVGYDASLNEDDQLLLRFLFLYERNFGETQTSYFQSQLVWGQAQISSPHTMSHIQHKYVAGSDHGDKWETLIEALDARRIRLTIANFPIFEEWLPRRKQKIETEEQNESSGNPNDVKNKLHRLDAEITGTSKESDILQPLEYVCQRSDTRDCYSPAFIMPLLLGILESFPLRAISCAETGPNGDVSNENNVSNQVKSEEKESEEKEDPEEQHRKSFVKIVYRLSQKGAISLSLSCLSSRCVGIRSLGVSTLYFFIQALKMKEAHDIAQWRERPQLEMVLNSVQRGLTLERAKKLKQLADEGITKYSSNELIPILPKVSSLFLARASLIISKPSDEMYSSMNRHFLRIHDFHGAYKHCFSLPSFINLFCSTENDSNQARRERIWALQLLKDGIVDEYSYKAVGRRHVPELIMSSFDAFCCWHDYDHSNGKLTAAFNAECCMILEVLQACLDFGGIPCYNYLINNVGLFAWIQKVLDSHSTKSIIGMNFFEMLHSALESTIHFYEQNDDTLSEFMPFNAISLAARVINTCEMKLSSKYEIDASLTEFLSTVCNILSLIKQLHESVNNNYVFTKIIFNASRDSISIASATFLIQKVENHNDLLQTLIRVLCYFPVGLNAATNVDGEGTSFIINYSTMSLKYILNHNFENNEIDKQQTKYLQHNYGDVKETFKNIMERIRIFSCEFRELFSCNANIAKLILSCRRKMNTVGLHDIWLRTMLCIVTLDEDRIDQDIEHQGNFFGESGTENFELIRWILKSEIKQNNGVVS